jgi:ferric-dicitrate binding protein FerR (iron transport regulator)
MSDAQSTWHLDGGRALTLAAGAEARRLSVARGRVWLTLSGTTEQPAEDTWLEAGQAVALAPGQTAVLEGWPAADFEVLVPPTAGASRAARPGRSFLLGGLLLSR